MIESFDGRVFVKREFPSIPGMDRLAAVAAVQMTVGVGSHISYHAYGKLDDPDLKGEIEKYIDDVRQNQLNTKHDLTMMIKGLVIGTVGSALCILGLAALVHSFGVHL